MATYNDTSYLYTSPITYYGGEIQEPTSQTQSGSSGVSGIVAKIYNNIRSSSPYDQIFIESDVSIEDDLMTFGVASFRMPLIENINKDQKIELYKVNEVGNDTRVFGGYIYDLIPIRKRFSEVDVVARSDKALFDNRKLLVDRKFVEVDFNTAVPTYPTGTLYDTYYNSGGISQIVDMSYPKDLPIQRRTQSKGVKIETYIYINNTGELLKFDGSTTSLGTFAGVPIKTVLQDLLDDYNDSYSEQWTLQCDVEEYIQIDMNMGDDYFETLDELAEQLGCFRDIQNKVLIFQKFDVFGVDRTQKNSQYQEVTFSGSAPTESNISDVRSKSSGQRANILIGQRTDGKKEVVDSEFSNIVYGVETKQFREGNFSSKSLAYIQDKNKNKTDYSFDIESNTLEAEIGDKIRLSIEGTNSFFDIDTSVYVTGKTTTFNKGEIQQFTFQEFPTLSFTEENRGRKITKQIKFNQLK